MNTKIISILVAFLIFAPSSYSQEEDACQKIADMANMGTLKNSLIELRKPNLIEKTIWDDYDKCDDAFPKNIDGIYEIGADKKRSLWSIGINTGMKTSYHQIRKEGQFCDIWLKIPDVYTPYGDIVSTVQSRARGYTDLTQVIALVDSIPYIVILNMYGGEIFYLDSALELDEKDAVKSTCGFEQTSTRYSGNNILNGPECDYLHSTRFKEYEWTYLDPYVAGYGQSEGTKYFTDLDIDNDKVPEHIVLTSNSYLSSCPSMYTSEVYKGEERVETIEKDIDSYFKDISCIPPSLTITDHGLAVVEHNMGEVKVILLSDKRSQCVTTEFPIFSVSKNPHSASMGPKDIQP